MTDCPNAAVEQAFREHWGLVVATLIRLTGDWDVAEDSAQEAFGLAAKTWSRDGVPNNPASWLIAAGRRRAVDSIRRQQVGARKLRELALIRTEGSSETELAATLISGVADDRLRLIFTCCHPALALEARVALTLRTLTGMTTREIARTFLVSESTMTRRLTRAKQKIQNAGIPYRVPPASSLPGRLDGVLNVLYLLFNEGYTATDGPDLVRPELSAEAIRLCRLLASLMGEEPEVEGLLALMLLHSARDPSRLDGHGDLVTLEQQDRSLWTQPAIREGTGLLERALRRGRPGPFQVQAAIAACHATAPSAAETDWRQIAGLYRELMRHNPSPIVQLNRAVAVAMAGEPGDGLEIIAELEREGSLAQYHLLPAAKADLLRRAGQPDAAHAYRDAIALARTEAERRYLRRRLQDITRAAPPSPAAREHEGDS